MDTDFTATFLGPVPSRATAEQMVDAAMARDHYGRVGVRPRDPLRTRAAGIYEIGNAHWIDVGTVDSLAIRIVQASPDLRVYRCFVENRFGDETHGGTLYRLELAGDPPRLATAHEEDFEEEDLIGGGMLHAAGLHYLIELVAEHEGFTAPREPPEPTSFLLFERPPDTGSKMVVRARQALAQAKTHQWSASGDRFELKMELADGSRRILVLTAAERAELEASGG